MIFKKIRSLVGRLFSENQQMIIILWLSQIFWNLRKYFLGVEIVYPPEFLDNWKAIKKKSSQDKERNFTVYQLIKLHNKLFSGRQTNIIRTFILLIALDFMRMKSKRMFLNMMSIIMESTYHLQ
jgi:hypothetical protein